jgi:hypothetical protein
MYRTKQHPSLINCLRRSCCLVRFLLGSLVRWFVGSLVRWFVLASVADARVEVQAQYVRNCSCTVNLVLGCVTPPHVDIGGLVRALAPVLKAQELEIFGGFPQQTPTPKRPAAYFLRDPCPAPVTILVAPRGILLSSTHLRFPVPSSSLLSAMRVRCRLLRLPRHRVLLPRSVFVFSRHTFSYKH